MGTKRDIDAAFTRFRLRPDIAAMCGTEFELSHDRGDAIVFPSHAFPFGFTGSLWIFGRIVEDVQFYRQQLTASCPI